MQINARQFTMEIFGGEKAVQIFIRLMQYLVPVNLREPFPSLVDFAYQIHSTTSLPGS